MRRTFLLATAAALIAAPAAFAQSQPGTGPSAGAAQAGSAASSSTARLSTMEFIRRAQMSDRFEIASSRLAQQNANAEAVRNFAAEMMRDHTRTTQELMELMQRVHGGPQVSGVAPQQGGSGTSSTGATTGSAAQGAGQSAGMAAAQGGLSAEGLDAEHQQMLQRLQSARGAEFDRLYMDMQVQAHQKAVEMFTGYSQHGDNAELKQWASKTLPALQQHLQRAQQIHRSL